MYYMLSPETSKQLETVWKYNLPKLENFKDRFSQQLVEHSKVFSRKILCSSTMFLEVRD